MSLREKERKSGREHYTQQFQQSFLHFHQLGARGCQKDHATGWWLPQRRTMGSVPGSAVRTGTAWKVSPPLDVTMVTGPVPHPSARKVGCIAFFVDLSWPHLYRYDWPYVTLSWLFYQLVLKLTLLFPCYFCIYLFFFSNPHCLIGDFTLSLLSISGGAEQRASLASGQYGNVRLPLLRQKGQFSLIFCPSKIIKN